MNMQENDRMPDRNNLDPGGRELHWPSIAQFSLSVLAILVTWGFGFVFLLIGLSDIISAGAGTTSAGSFLMAGGAFFGGLLVIPSAFYSFMRILGKPVERGLFSRRWVLAFLGVPVVFLIGYLVSSRAWLAITVLPWMHVLAIGLPVLGVFVIVQQRLPRSSPQTNWGSLAIGLVAGPLLILILEILVMFIAFLLLGLYIQQDPAMMSNLLSLSERFSQGTIGIEEITDRLGDLLRDPVLLASLFAMGSVLIPLIEEFLKPIAVWVLLGRDLAPSDGFVLGVISGAGYAIFENLALSSNSGSDWTFVLLARLGTTLLHMATSGLVGWGIVMTFRHRKYMRFPLMYLGAAIMHAIWNGSVISNSVFGLIPTEDVPAVFWAAGTTEYVLIGLSLLSILIMFSMNIYLRRAIMSPASAGPDAATPDTEIETS